MTTAEFLLQLERLDVKVWAEGDRLRCSAPRGILTSQLSATLASRKAEVLAFLRTAHSSAIRCALIPIQPAGSRRPLFGVPGHNGDVFCYVRLAHYMGKDQPFYALEPPGVDGRRAPLTRIEDLAAHFVRELRAFQPKDPYLLAGYCLGGIVAFEVAQQLRAEGQAVAMLALLECPCPTAYLLSHRIRVLLSERTRWAANHVRRILRMGPSEQFRYLIEQARKVKERMVRRGKTRNDSSMVSNLSTQVEEAHLAAARQYVPTVYPGRIHFLFASATSQKLSHRRQLDWGAFAAGGLKVYSGPEGCTASAMLREPHVQVFAEYLWSSLTQLEADGEVVA